MTALAIASFKYSPMAENQSGSSFKTADNTLDPATGFTPREISEISTTWDFIKSDSSDNGMDLFINFFSMFPEYQVCFTSVANERLDRLRSSVRLRGHTDGVMTYIGNVVEQIATKSSIKLSLQNLGQNHSKFNVPPKAFEDFKSVFLHWLRQKLGTKMTLVTNSAWEKTMTLIVNSMAKGMVHKSVNPAATKSK